MGSRCAVVSFPEVASRDRGPGFPPTESRSQKLDSRRRNRRSSKTREMTGSSSKRRLLGGYATKRRGHDVLAPAWTDAAACAALEALDEVRAFVASWGPHVVVEHPPALAARLAGDARQTAAAYLGA